LTAFARPTGAPFAGRLTGLPALVIALAVAAGLAQSPAQAQEMDCAVLMDDVKAGKLYAVTRLEDKGQVKIETVKGHCFEPIATWDARGLPMASLGSSAFIPPPKKKKATPPPISGIGSESDLPILQKRLTEPPPTSAYSGDGGVLPIPGRHRPAEETPQEGAAAPAEGQGEEAPHVGTAAPAEGQVEGQPEGTPTSADTSTDPQTPAGEKAPDSHDRCDRTIGDFWGPGEIDIKGSKYYLSGAFTVDKDGDGWVDNVGFKLKLVGRVGNVIRYFDSPGRLSGQTTPDLKLPNDSDITRLCAGDVMFKLPKRFQSKEEEKEEKEPEKAPEPGQETVKEPEKEKPEEAPKEKPKKGPSKAAMLVITGAGILLLISGIVTLFLLQPELASRREKKKKEEEAAKKAEGGEDGDEEEES